MSRLPTIFAAIAALLLGAGPAYADQAGTITKVEQTQDRFFVYLTGTRVTKPGCDCCGRWEVFTGSTSGQAMISILLTAYSSHKTVSISGTNACVSGANDTEGINLVSVAY